MDANHCPSAAIVLITTSSGKQILHTGDFRYNSHMKTQVQAITQKDMLDIIYLDTTYCKPEHAFPPQNIVIDAVMDEILHLGGNVQDQVYLFGSYTIGKERVFLEVQILYYPFL